MPARRGKFPGGLVSPESFDAEDQVVHTFTIPLKDKFGPVFDPRWNRPDEERKFSLVTLTPDREEKAAAAAGVQQNFQAVFQEMIRMSVYKIGDRKVRGRRDEIKAWLNEMGPRARKYVESAFNRLTSVSEADLDSFLEAVEVETA